MSFLHTPSRIVNPLAHDRRFGFGSGVGGSSIPDLPAGATARWNVLASTGSDGDLLASVSDLIGSNTATAAGSARPTLKTGAGGLNSKPVMRFNGVANSLTLGTNITGVNTYTIAVVMKRTGADMCPLGTLNFLPALIRTSTFISTGDASAYKEASNNGTGWEIIVAGRASNDSFGMRNGAALTFGSSNAYVTAATFSRIGSRTYVYSNGDFADILYWPTALTADERLAVCQNLNATWGGVY